MKFYENKTVLITGASSGIGEALALALAPTGARLILVARRPEELDRVAELCRKAGAREATCFALDLLDYPGQDRLRDDLMKATYRIDVLINNAGVSQRATVAESTEETERQLMELNYFAQVRFTRTLLPLLTSSPRIGVISSLSGLFGFPQRSTYSASKHALKGFFESWQLENRKLGICLIYPGRIKSNISRNALTGTGERYRKMDRAQEKGMPATECAERIVRALAKRKKRLVIGRKELILYWFYKHVPFLFYPIASSINPNKH